MISPEHLIKHLQANAIIAAAVGTATVKGLTGVPVLAEIKTDNIAGQMPRRAVVITTSGGIEIVGPNDLARARMDVRCYGAHMADAWLLNDAVYGELRYNRPLTINGKHVTSTLRPVVAGYRITTADGDWPFVFTEYTLVISEGR